VKRRQAKRRRKQWAAKRIHSKCKSAIAVQWALVEMADDRGSDVVTPTRKTLSARTGIKRLNTISEALTTLTRAGWIDRDLIPVGRGKDQKRLLRLIVRRKPRKTLLTGARAVNHEKRCNSKPRKTLLDSSKEEGVAQQSPPPASLRVEPGHPPDGSHNLPPYEWQPGDPKWLQGRSSDTEVITNEQ